MIWASAVIKIDLDVWRMSGRGGVTTHISKEITAVSGSRQKVRRYAFDCENSCGTFVVPTALRTVARRSTSDIYIVKKSDDSGQFLTPLIEKKAVKSARDASFAKMFKMRANATAYSGFITVNKEHQANVYFIYMQAQINPERAPLMIYLQGGPGKSGTFGQFLEVGPLGVNSDGILYRRPHTVQKMFNVIFLDQPAGSGFSFTNLMTNPDPGLPLKVSGVIAGSPVFGCVLDLMDSADTLYHFGMFDANGRDMFAQAMHRIRQLWTTNRAVALDLLSHTIFGLHHSASLFANLTGYSDHASLFSDERPQEFIHYYRYMQKPLFKKSLHLNSQATVDSNRLLVMLYLADDYIVDLREKVEYLLDATKMLVFSGQLDTVFPAIKQEKHLLSLNWTGTVAMRKAARRPLYVSGPGSRLVGYAKTTKDLTYVVMARSGHHVLFDASEDVCNIIERFVTGVDVVNFRRKVLGVN
ncbi:hypothetical protein HPB49_010260 [Dermacentor silvarum]|uniref:Uncharacterized protein n=1 Tax=Dermacentor silvarum TaxID=543639 RepID=A0ACB8DNM6_DERSI|nr:hypothetical protein HPB49_010260 [Dermacentor silvarum]